jgi:hypothetical protein
LNSHQVRNPQVGITLFTGGVGLALASCFGCSVVVSTFFSLALAIRFFRLSAFVSATFLAGISAPFIGYIVYNAEFSSAIQYNPLGEKNQ